MSQRDWWHGDLIASALLVVLFGIVSALMWATPNEPQEVKVSTYEDATVLCAEWEETPWDVSACQWRAYESFYGTDAARAAYGTATEAR